MQIILRGQPWAPCPQKHIKCWPETLAIASWDLLIPHSVPPAAPPPPTTTTSISHAFNSTGGVGLLSLCGLRVSIYESLSLKAAASHGATTYTAASIRTFDLFLWGRKCQEYAKPKLSYLCHTHNFCTMGTVNIIAVCLRDCSGNRASHSRRRVFPSDV